MKGVFMVLGVFILAVVYVGVLPFVVDFSKASPEAVAYFEKEIKDEALSRVGQPIEGFDAYILRDAFPALHSTDFDGVASLEGEYYTENNSLLYRRTAGDLVTSAEGMITKKGYETLLSNLFDRFEISPRDIFGAERIIVLIEGGDIEKNLSLGYFTNDYIVRHSEAWYPHITNPAVVFTRGEESPVSEDEVSSLEEYIFIKKGVGEPSLFSIVDEREVMTGGVSFTRFVTEDENGEKTLLYVYEKGDITLMQHPYDQESSATRDFERMVQTFNPVR